MDAPGITAFLQLNPLVFQEFGKVLVKFLFLNRFHIPFLCRTSLFLRLWAITEHLSLCKATCERASLPLADPQTIQNLIKLAQGFPGTISLPPPVKQQWVALIVGRAQKCDKGAAEKLRSHFESSGRFQFYCALFMVPARGPLSGRSSPPPAGVAPVLAPAGGFSGGPLNQEPWSYNLRFAGGSPGGTTAERLIPGRTPRAIGRIFRLLPAIPDAFLARRFLRVEGQRFGGRFARSRVDAR